MGSIHWRRRGTERRPQRTDERGTAEELNPVLTLPENGYNGAELSEGNAMNAIRIRKTIDSETLYLPELKPLLGRAVEIIVLEEDTSSTIRPGTGDWEAAEKAAQELRAGGYDFDAWRVQREYDLKHANDHLP